MKKQKNLKINLFEANEYEVSEIEMECEGSE